MGQFGSVLQRANELSPLVVASIAQKKYTSHTTSDAFVNVHLPLKFRVNIFVSDIIDKRIMLGNRLVVTRTKETSGTMKNFPAVRACHRICKGRKAFLSCAQNRNFV
jgi:hypothetical protein